MRKIKITRNYILYPEGSVLIEVGNTKIICNASVSDRVPSFCKDEGKGWVTAEYSMLPRATSTRTSREAARGKIGGRTAEIQRLIGRSLRGVVDLKLLEGWVINLDCDVIQADGGTRTASITGACVALNDAFEYMIKSNMIAENPLKEWVAAISVGVFDGEFVLDLDYEHDSKADVDLNVVMTESGKLIEVQGTAEGNPFSRADLNDLVALAEEGITELVKLQKESVTS